MPVSPTRRSPSPNSGASGHHHHHAAGGGPPASVRGVSYDDMFPDLLDVMEFESWWTERNPNGGGTVRRYMLILYFPSESQFQVTVDDSKTPLTLKVVNRHGEPLHAYDLYVGAVIDVLGRPTTLMSASLRTISWLEKHTRRLWKRKQALEEKANKFRPTPLHTLETGLYKRLQDANVATGGTIPLRRVLDIIRALELELSEYQ